MVYNEIGSREFGPFFDNLSKGNLSFPYCGQCGRFHWYPMNVCRHCGGDDIGWKAIHGEATLFSWTVVRFEFSRTLQQEIPYIVGLVEFPEAPGIKFITNLVDIDATVLVEGLELEPVIRQEQPPRVEFRRRQTAYSDAA